MKLRRRARRRRSRLGRRAARLLLLMLPVLFWSCVFAALAGVRILDFGF